MQEKLGHLDLNGFDLKMTVKSNAIDFFSNPGAVLDLPSNQPKSTKKAELAVLIS